MTCTTLRLFSATAAAALMLSACGEPDYADSPEFDAAQNPPPVTDEAAIYSDDVENEMDMGSEPSADAQVDDTIQFPTSSEIAIDSGNTLATVVETDQMFSTLAAALNAADLAGSLDGPVEYTVLAPTNDAFGQLPDGTLDVLLQDDNKQDLQVLLGHHLIPGVFMAEDIVAAIENNGGSAALETAAPESLTATLDDGTVFIEGGNGDIVRVIRTDVTAENGVVHVIDGVLMPN